MAANCADRASIVFATSTAIVGANPVRRAAIDEVRRRTLPRPKRTNSDWDPNLWTWARYSSRSSSRTPAWSPTALAWCGRALVTAAGRQEPRDERAAPHLHRRRHATGRGSNRIMVSDTGIGISAENLSPVFDRLWRADPSRTRDTDGSAWGWRSCTRSYALTAARSPSRARSGTSRRSSSSSFSAQSRHTIRISSAQPVGSIPDMHRKR